nr:hypothetical protein [Nocardia cyriacigeorgica]
MATHTDEASRLSRPASLPSTVSNASSSCSSRPPLASEDASSSSVSSGSSSTVPARPATNRGRSASGHTSVVATGGAGAGGTGAVAPAEAGGRPSTGSRNRASSRRA